MHQRDFLGDFIHGRFVNDPTGHPFRSMNPTTIDEVICQATERSDSIAQAIESSRKALKSWRKGEFADRVKALKAVANKVSEHQERIAQAITLEMGKPIAEARIEAGSIKSKIEGVIEHLAYTLSGAPPNAPGEQRFHSLGVIAIIGPFNFPIHLLNTHVIPALLTGNTVIIKPSEITPLCGQRYLELFQDAHFPAGVLNLIQGRGNVGAQLIEHSDINGVIFTGSYQTGRQIRQATFDQPYKKVCLELGGSNPAIVLDDADLDQACREILLGALLTSGQRCTATSRVIATPQIADELKHRLINCFKRITPLDPSHPNCFIGPLSSIQAQRHFMSLLTQAKEQGAHPWVESYASAQSAFVTPSIYGVQGHEAYLNEEVFGPHLAFQVVENQDQAFQWASRNSYGLSASIFTRSKETFEEFYDTVKAGVLNWNRSTNGASGLLPFGGVGKSGNWHPAGSEGPRLSTYPVAIMSLPYGQITPNIQLDAQLSSPPIDLLEKQHRLEEVTERFGLWIEEKGLDLHLPFDQIKVNSGGMPLTAHVLKTRAQMLGLPTDESGLRFSIREDLNLPQTEDQLLEFFKGLVELDPESFLTRPKREINTPKDGLLPRSTYFLERYYGGGQFCPREKKPAVVDLAKSQGPFLRSVDQPPLQILDAASQIASLPAGFRSHAVQRELDDGTFDQDMCYSPLPNELGGESTFKALEQALLKHTSPLIQHACWTNGGAEANEKAFHLAQLHGDPQKGTGGHRILAFEGSFHGRTLLSLYSTWNPVKRAPYQFKGYEAVFLKRPLPEDPYFDPPIPSGWYKAWSTPTLDKESLKQEINNTSANDASSNDALLHEEIHILLAVEQAIKQGEILGCIIEPYQCEGGDVTPTRRFFHGLRALTQGYEVPLIFDEVQSGFGLSGPVFWYHNLQLVDDQGHPQGPDLITGAKRGQLGYVLSRWPDPMVGPAHSSSALRGLIHLQLIQDTAPQQDLQHTLLTELVGRWPSLIFRPRTFGDSFAFDLPSKAIALHLIAQRFYRGYMVYIAGEKTLRYRMNRGFTPSEIKGVFQVIESSLEALVEQAGGQGEGLIDRMNQCSAPVWSNSAQPQPEFSITLTEIFTVPGDADLFL